MTDTISGSQLTLSLQPKQQELFEAIVYSNYSWIAYGGARGGAKSHALRDIAMVCAFRLNLPVLIMRRIRDELLNNHVYPLFKHYPWVRDYYNKQEMTIFHPVTGLPAIKFGYAERNDDIFKFQGTEYAIIFIDEATQMSQEQIEFLSSSNRDPSDRILPKMVLTCNPGGISHAYIKRLFVDRQYMPNEDPNDYYFIQAHVWDNWFWVKRQLGIDGYSLKNYYDDWDEKKRMDYCLQYSRYAKRLSGLPEDLRLAYLFGDWNVFAGMFFKQFNIKKQLIKPFYIPKSWRLFAALDPGYSSPCSFSISAVDTEFNVFRVATYYEKEKSAPNHARDILTFIQNLKLTGGRMPERIVADPSAWQKRERFAAVEDERTFADHFEAVGIFLEKAVNDRVTGWWNMKDFIERKNKNGSPKYYVFANYNKPFIDQLLSTLADDKNVEDIQGKGNDPDVQDHAIDEERYKLMMIQETIPEPVDSTPAWFKEDILKDDDDYSVMSV